MDKIGCWQGVQLKNFSPHDAQKRTDEWEAKEFLSYGKFCHQISPHTRMKSQSLYRELEALQWSEASWWAPRAPISVKAVMRHVPRL